MAVPQRTTNAGIHGAGRDQLVHPSAPGWDQASCLADDHPAFFLNTSFEGVFIVFLCVCLVQDHKSWSPSFAENSASISLAYYQSPLLIPPVLHEVTHWLPEPILAMVSSCAYRVWLPLNCQWIYPYLGLFSRRENKAGGGWLGPSQKYQKNPCRPSNHVNFLDNHGASISEPCLEERKM